MEARIRIRIGDAEIEAAGEEAFVVDQFPKLVADLIGQLRGRSAPPVSQPSAPPASGVPPLMSIAGEVHDYWSGVAVAGARVGTLGLAPEIEAESDDAGRFVMSGPSAGGTALIVVAGPDPYAETRTGPLELSPGAISRTAFIVTQADLNRQYVIGNLPRELDSATVIVELLNAAGEPLETVSGADLVLGDAGTGSAGPFFFGPTGDVDRTLVMSQAFDGRARAAFLNVPPGNSTLVLTGVGESGSWQRTSIAVNAFERGALLVQARLPA